MLLTVSNLHPRPDRPGRGMFNAQLFAAMARQGRAEGVPALVNLCPVPEWRLWRWPGIRRWRDPGVRPYATAYVPAFYVPVLGRSGMADMYRRALGPFAGRMADADAVYGAWLYPDAVAAVRIAAAVGRPAWMMALGSDTFHLAHRTRRRAILRAAEQAAGIVCVAPHLRDRLAAAGVNAAKLHVVPNGVDADRFHPRPRREARACLAARLEDEGTETARRLLGLLREDASEPLVLFVGNLVPVKGPDVLVRASEMLAQTGGAARTRVLLLGDGPMRPGLARAAGAHALCAGSRPHEEIALWMNAADCLCLPSRAEGMPNVALEALASGLPVAASDAAACGELLAGRADSALFASGDSAACADALRRVLAGVRDGRSPAQGGRRVPSWDEQAAKILTLVCG